MASLNSCHFIGNLTRDPEITQTPTGKTKANLSLAVNDRVGNAERTTYLYFTAWEQNATFCANYLRKGSQVHIQARAAQDVWTDKTGKTQRKTYFHVDYIQALGPREQTTQPPPDNRQAQHYQQKANGYQPQPQSSIADADIPF